MSEDVAPDGTPPADVERTTSGARMMSELRQAQARADRAERELDRTKRSAAYVVGDLLVQAAKDPRRLLMLPRDLWRTWRLRRSWSAPRRPGVCRRARRPRSSLLAIAEPVDDDLSDALTGMAVPQRWAPGDVDFAR